MYKKLKYYINKTYIFSSLVLMISFYIFFCFNYGNAAPITNRSLFISSSVASATNVNYSLSFSIDDTYLLGSVVLEICKNNPFPGTSCTAPTGFDASAVSIISQSGQVGFSVNTLSTSNTIILGRTPIMGSPGNLKYNLGSITNPSDNGTYYARIYTYSSNDGSGIPVDTGGLAFAINNNISITTEVPPFLQFCAAVNISGFDCSTAVDTYVNFNNFSSANVSTAQSQTLSATNAQFGLSISINGNTLTSGNNIINASTVPTPSHIGMSQFGINLVANSSPDIGSNVIGPGSTYASAPYSSANNFTFNSADTIATSTTSSDWSKFTISYIANVSSSQPPGVYTSTFTFVCLANF